MNLQMSSLIDVRPIPRALRHDLVFGAFDRLPPSGTLEVISDHDPRPLRYLFDLKRRNGFDWDYIERGPDFWRILIIKEGPAQS
jgi:uncharacterized protein (DUF2249 family)